MNLDNMKQSGSGCGMRLGPPSREHAPDALPIRHSSFVIRHLPFRIRHSSFVIRHLPSRIRHSSFVIRHLPLRIRHFALRAFTLIEMLTVIAIIGILAAIIGPSLGHFKPDITAAATQQLLGDIGRARQLAISQHTTVYMVFVPPGFMQDTACSSLWNSQVTRPEWAKCLPLLDKQLTGYNFVSLRSVGDQPGQHNARYWSSWKTLPEGVFICTNKFKFDPTSPTNQFFFAIYTNTPGAVNSIAQYMTVAAFNRTIAIPFPSELTPALGQRWARLPYIAFNYLGQLVDDSGNLRSLDEAIPLAKGSVVYPHDAATRTNNPAGLPSAIEAPAGNSTTNSFNLVCIDRLTGRTYVRRQDVK